MNLLRLLISPRDRHSDKPLKSPHSCRNIARLSIQSLVLAGVFGSAVAADPEPNSNTTADPITPPIAITEDGKFQLGDMDLGPFGVSPMEEFLEPPVDDPAAEQVEQVVLRNITNLRENLPKLIEQIRDIENNPELTDEGLVSLFSDFVELVNGSLPTHELVVESVETTRETLLDVHEKILALVTQFDQTSQLNGEALSSLENTLPLIFGGDGCETDVAALIEGAVSGVAGSVLNIQRQQVRNRCGGDIDPELLRTQMLANPYASLSPQAQKQAQESAIVSRPSTTAVGGVPGLPGADGLLDGDNIDDLINGSSSSLTGFIQDLFAGEGLDLSNLNDTATALYDFTGRAGLPFAWVQIQDAVIPWVPGAVLPLVTQGPHGLELLLIRLQPVLRLTDNNQGNVIEAIANGSILLDAAIQVVIERPMANQLINFVQSHELIRNLQASAAGNLVADTLRQATPLGGLLDPVLDPIIGGNNNLARIIESAAEGNVSAIVELILRRFPTVLAAVPGGDIVPVSGEDIASLLGYDIEQAYSNGEGVCDPFPITATTYVQLDRSSTGSIFFARFDGALPRRIEANVGSNANFNVSFNNDLAVGASITLSPMCTQVPLDDDLKGLFGDLDLSLGTDLVGLYEEAVPPAADREPFVPDVNNPPDENDQFRMGPFSSAPTGDFLELSGGIMTNAFLLEEADARYARFALELPIEERFTLSVQAGVEDGEIFAQAGVDEGLYVALAAYTKNILSLFNLPIIDDTDERLLAVMQIFGLNSALRLEAGADSGGNDGLFADWQLIDPITEVNVAIPLFAGLRAQFGILNVPEFAAICAAPGPICPNNGYDSNHSDVLASARIELSEEAYPYFALLTREGGFVQGSFMTKFGTWLGFNFEQFFSRSNRVFLGFDTGGETIGGDASIVRCGTNADTPEDAANGLCANVVGFSIGGWIKGKVVELVDPINQETLIALVQQVVAAFEEIFSFLNDIILDFLNSVADLFEDIGSAIQQVGSLIGNAIGGFFGCLGNITTAGSCIDRLGDRLQEQVANSFDLDFGDFEEFARRAENRFNEFLNNFRFDISAFSPIQLHGSIGCSAERTRLDLDLELIIPDLENLLNNTIGGIFGGNIDLGFLNGIVGGVGDLIENLSGLIVGSICKGVGDVDRDGINFFTGDGIVEDTNNNIGGLVGGVPLLGTGVNDLLGTDSVLDGILGDDGIDSLPTELGPIQDTVDGLLGTGDGNAIVPQPVIDTVAAVLGDENAGSPLDPSRLGELTDSLLTPDDSGQLPLSPERILDSADNLLGSELPLTDIPAADVVETTLDSVLTGGEGVTGGLPLTNLPLVGDALQPAQELLDDTNLGELANLSNAVDLDEQLSPATSVGQTVLGAVSDSPLPQALAPINQIAPAIQEPLSGVLDGISENLPAAPAEPPLVGGIDNGGADVLSGIVGPEIPSVALDRLNELLNNQAGNVALAQLAELINSNPISGPDGSPLAELINNDAISGAALSEVLQGLINSSNPNDGLAALLPLLDNAGGTTPPSLPLDQLPLDQLPLDDLPLGQLPIGELPTDGLPLDGLPLDGLPLEQLPLDGLPVGELPLGQLPIGDLPTDSLPVGDLPASLPGLGGLDALTGLVGNLPLAPNS